MRSAVPPAMRMLACNRGSTFVGYSSLILLVAIAAITLLARSDLGPGSAPQQGTTRAAPSD